MRARVQIEDLRIPCVIGCLEEERDRNQEIVVSLELEIDSRQAAYEDRLEHTVDYVALERAVRFILAAGQFRLLETAGHVLVRAVCCLRAN